MTEPTTLKIRLIAYYAAALPAMGLLSVITLWLLRSDGIELGSFLVIFFAAMLPGDMYFRRTRRLPESKFAWEMAGWFTLTTFIISSFVTLIEINLGENYLVGAVNDAGFWTWFIVLSVIVVLPIRYSFVAGASGAKKHIEAQQLKAAKTKPGSSKF